MMFSGIFDLLNITFYYHDTQKALFYAKTRDLCSHWSLSVSRCDMEVVTRIQTRNILDCDHAINQTNISDHSCNHSEQFFFKKNPSNSAIRNPPQAGKGEDTGHNNSTKHNIKLYSATTLLTLLQQCCSLEELVIISIRYCTLNFGHEIAASNRN